MTRLARVAALSALSIAASCRTMQASEALAAGGRATDCRMDSDCDSDHVCSAYVCVARRDKLARRVQLSSGAKVEQASQPPASPEPAQSKPETQPPDTASDAGSGATEMTASCSVDADCGSGQFCSGYGCARRKDQAAPQAPASPAEHAPAAATGSVRWKSMVHARDARPLTPEGPTAGNLRSVTVPASRPATPAGAALASNVAQPDFRKPRTEMAIDSSGIALTVDRQLESERLRQAWMQRGGSISSFEFTANGSFMLMSEFNAMGGGGGLGLKTARLNFTAPQYATRDRSWSAFKLGFGLDAQMFYSKFWAKAPNRYGGGGTYVAVFESSQAQLTVPGALGFVAAFGSFDSPTEWSGFSVGADWAPSYTMTVNTKGGSPDGNFNYAGFALNFQSGSLTAHLSDISKEAHFKLSFFVLPPVTKSLPLLVSTNIGAVWY